MRGSDVRAGDLFSYVDLEKRVPAKHPLRLVRVVVNEVLSRLDGDFAKAYAIGGRPSIAPERLLRALLLQAFYTIRSERQLMEQLDYNLLYRWCRRAGRGRGGMGAYGVHQEPRSVA
jgi:transposase